MKKSKSSLSILVLSGLTGLQIAVPQKAFALENSDGQPTRATTVESQGGSTYPTSYPNAFTNVSSGSGGSAASSGRSAAAGQLLTAGVNAGAAVVYMKVCTPKTPWYCVFAGVAVSAANMLLSGSKGSSAAGNSMSAYDPNQYQFPGMGDGSGTGNPDYNYAGTPGGYDGTPGSGPGGANGPGSTLNPGGSAPGANGINGINGLPPGVPSTPSSIAATIDQIKTGLTEAGVTISTDGRTMTTKDGRKFDLSKTGDGSEQSMIAMGLSPSEAAQVAATGKAYSNKIAASMSKISIDGGGGGGGLGSRGPAADDGGGGGGRYGGFNFDPRNKARAKAKVSGLTKKLGDEPIGVSQDDIFEMVTRRYKARDQENQFLKD